MYSKKLKELSVKLDKTHIPESFKFGEFENGYDMMCLYEELFSYSYEVQKEFSSLASGNFNYFKRNSDEVLILLKNEIQKNNENKEICEVCLEFCKALLDECSFDV